MSAGEKIKPHMKRSFVRYWSLWILLAMAALGLAIVWSIPLGNFGRAQRIVATLCGLAVFLLLLAFWLLAWSGFPWRQRLSLFLVSVAILVGAGWMSIRGVQFTGDVFPIIQFRWERDRDALLEAHRRHQAAAAAPAAIQSSRLEAAEFPGYRGRQRDGIVQGPPLARDWKTHAPRMLWRQPGGGGYAAFAIAGQVAVTIEQRRDREAIVCYDAASGTERWVHAYPAHFSERLGGEGPRATPTVAAAAVFSLGATGRLSCLDLATGSLKWEVEILAENDNLPWGMSGSPLVYDQFVVVNPGSQRTTAAGRALVAYDRATGRQAWSAGSTKAGYSSPMLANLAGQRQILVLDGEMLAGYDPQSGKELWRFAWQTFQDINVAQPVVLDGDRVFISSGYDKGCAMLRVTESAGGWKAEPLWQNHNMRCKFTSPVAYNGYLYGLDEGILTCIDQRTGDRKWRDGRYGHGQLLLANDVLLIQSETGKLVLVEATPQGHHELGSIQALEGKTWNNPALAGGKAFLRNSEEMACYDLTPPQGN
jgi:outer membrane protein assembly factor BamB